MAVLSKVANIAVQPQPVGVVEAFAGSNAPNGWLICDGSQVLRSLYPELFSVIGTTYGSGDGFSTFTLPDLRGRTIAGRDGVNNMNNGPTNRLTSTHFGASGTALGNSGGSESHTLTTAQLASHNHTQDAHSHNVTDSGGFTPSVSNIGPPGGGVGYYARNQPSGQILYTDSRTPGIQNTGGGNAHNNTQPTMILNYIIKAVSELPRGGWYNSSSPDLVTSLPTNPYVGQEVYHQQSGYPYHKRYNGSTWDRTSNDIIICTSATRPSNPQEGQEIYETNTDKKLIYDGTNWIEFGPSGRITQALQSQSTQITSNSTSWTTIVSQSITTTRANSKILTMFSADCNALNDGAWKRIGIFVNGSLQYYVISSTATNQYQEVVSMQHLYTASSIGTYTITASAQQGAGSSNFGEEGGSHKNNLVVLEIW